MAATFLFVPPEKGHEGQFAKKEDNSRKELKAGFGRYSPGSLATHKLEKTVVIWDVSCGHDGLN
jgi:hypothetical protein